MLNPKRLRFEALLEMGRHDALVFAGGEQVQEGRLGNFLWGHVPTLANLMAVASRRGVRTMLWAVGVERVQNPINRSRIRAALEKADAATVRDTASRERLIGYGVTREVIVAADPVFALQPVSRVHAKRVVCARLGIEEEQKLILLTPANDRRVSLDYLRALVNGVRRAAHRHGATIVVNIMDRQPSYDMKLASRRELSKSAGVRWYPFAPTGLLEIVQLHAAADVVISSRMHPLIIAVTQGTPIVNVARAAKMLALAADMSLPALHISSLEEEQVYSHVARLLDRGRDDWQRSTAPALAALRIRARLSGELFARQIASGVP
jgi:polysaccharide pyruvyl transferase WcaK-like protein